MERVIDFKENYCPVVINNTYIIISFNYKEEENDFNIGDFASWFKLILPYPQSFNDIKSCIMDEINHMTQENILKTFMWAGRQVWLSQENQFNYKMAYDLAIQTNGASLPVTFKFGDSSKPLYYQFKTIDELSKFYMDMVQFINKQLEDCWRIKDSINWDDYKV